MVTDPQRRYRTDPGRPEVCNVYTLHTTYSSPDEQAEVYHRCTNALQGCVECKEWLARNLDAALAPFRARREEFAADPERVEEILGDGAARARAVATETIARGPGACRPARDPPLIVHALTPGPFPLGKGSGSNDAIRYFAR